MKSVLAAIVLTMTPTMVFAQNGLPAAGEAVNGGINTTTTKPTEYEFPDDYVESVLTKPDESLLPGELRGKTTSLIHVRSNFVPELMMSVEHI